MKRKPDTMIAVIGLFVLGLIISGFSSFSVGADDESVQETKKQVVYDRSVSRF